MRVLLDTNVISEIRRKDANPLVIQRVAAINAQDVYLSVITLGEIVYGVKRLPAGKKRRELERWVSVLGTIYATQLLTVDLETTRIWGECMAACEAGGRRIPPADGLIAATALRHGLHLMTRNVKNFQGMGVLVSNPWEP